MRGRNPARDIQADGASDPGSPMASGVALFCGIGHLSHARKIGLLVEFVSELWLGQITELME